MPKICNRDSVIISTTATEQEADFSYLIHALPEGKKNQRDWMWERKHPLEAEKEFLCIPADISYGVSGLNLSAIKTAYSGEIRVLARILSLNYLWNEIRVKGGAYGAGFTVSESGNAFFYSFRDPNVARSLALYKKSADFLREFCRGEEELEKYIIGTMTELEPLQTTFAWMEGCDSDYFRGITPKDRKEERKEMLSLTKEKLLSYADVLEQIAEKEAVCVVGNEYAFDTLSQEAYVRLSL